MPEGPEATYLASVLNAKYAGKTLRTVKFVSGRYTHHGLPDKYAEFASGLPSRLSKVESAGKIIIFYFENGWTAISRLGMTGWWYQQGRAPQWRESASKPNVIFEFRQAPDLIYTDFRNFGTLSFTRDPSPDIEKLAPSIMATDITVKTLLSRMRPRRGDNLLEDALVDQTYIVSGIGNYLKSEILYSARISPLRKIKDVTEAEWNSILREGKRISKLMLAQLYKENPLEYTNAIKVYQRDFDEHGNKIERHTTKAGRTTFWVSKLQK